jgi:two-component system, cell cycle response regulator DivK
MHLSSQSQRPTPNAAAARETVAWDLGIGRWELITEVNPGLRVWVMPKILLVEDNEMNRDMLSRRLERQGYEVVIAPDGIQGISRARTESPDLILMDMNLPEIDGWEAARCLKLDAATRQIPLIALTAHAMVSDKQRALEAGCDDYETKPVEFQRLLAKIQTILEQGTAR